MEGVTVTALAGAIEAHYARERRIERLGRVALGLSALAFGLATLWAVL